MNPKLKVGDRVCLLYMSGEIKMNPGECGVVKSVDNVFGDIQYGVKWDNGSNLALLSDTDAWKFEKKQIKEGELEKMNIFYIFSLLNSVKTLFTLWLNDFTITCFL